MKIRYLEFGDFRVDVINHELLREGKPVSLAPKAFDTLQFLLENPRRLVTREQIMKAVWPDSFVEDGNVSVNIFQLRKMLGELEGGKPFIETVPRKGYRFNADVKTLEEEAEKGFSGAEADSLHGSRQSDADAENMGLPAGLLSGSMRSERPSSRESALIARGGALPEVIPFPESRVASPAPMTEPSPRVEIEPAQTTQPKISRRRRFWPLIIGICVATIVVVVIAGSKLWKRGAERSSQAIERRLTSFAPEMAVTAAAVSTGGKFIAYANPGGLFVQIIATGETHQLQLPDADFGVASISWFPDSASLLVDGSAPTDAAPSLWIVPVIGASHPIELGPFPPGTVSPDGSEIALLDNRGSAPEIRLINARGGGIRTLVMGEAGEVFGGANWFDRGKRLLLVRYRWDPQFRMNRGSIDSVDLSTGRTEVVMSAGDLGGDAVSVDGGRIVYSQIAGANPATSGARLMEIRTDPGTGKAAGSPRVIARWDSQIAGITANRVGTQIVLRDLSVQHNVYMAEISDGGLGLGAPARLSFGAGREDFPRAWAADGRGIYLDTNRNGNWEIYKRNLDAGPALPFVTGPDDQFSPRLSPDGGSVLYIDRPANWRPGDSARIMRISTTGGLPQTVLTSSGFSEWGLRFECPHGAGLPCLLAEQQGKQVIFRPFDPIKGFLSTAQESGIARCDASPPVQWTLAPDASSMAWISRGTGEAVIHVIPLERSAGSLTAKQERDLVIDGWTRPRSIRWAPDGKGWFLVSSSGSSWTLLYVSPQGKAKVLMRNLSNWAPDIYPSPDGRRLAFSKESFNSNVWILQRF